MNLALFSYRSVQAALLSALLASACSLGSAAPLQVRGHATTRPEAPPPAAQPMPVCAVNVLVQAQGKALSGQTVIVSQKHNTITTAPTGSDGIAHIVLGKAAAYTFAVQGAPNSTMRVFTVKANGGGAPQTLTLTLNAAPPA